MRSGAVCQRCSRPLHCVCCSKEQCTAHVVVDAPKEGGGNKTTSLFRCLLNAVGWVPNNHVCARHQPPPASWHSGTTCTVVNLRLIRLEGGWWECCLVPLLLAGRPKCCHTVHDLHEPPTKRAFGVHAGCRRSCCPGRSPCLACR